MNRNRLALARVVALAAGGSLLGSAGLQAQCDGTPMQVLRAGDGGGIDYFGGAAAAWGDTAVIGAPNKDLWYGGAYVFQLVNGRWIQTDALESSDRAQYDLFGSELDLEDGRLVVGANQWIAINQKPGKAYVFEGGGGTFTESAILLASDGDVHDKFGRSVAVSGDRIAVSATGDDDLFDESGSVYLFEFDGSSWIEVQKITSPNPVQGGVFGRSLAMQGDTLMVGCPGDQTSAPNAGAVYFYEFDGSSFVLEASLYGLESGGLGWQVDLDGGRALASAAAAELSSFVHDGSTWVQDQVIVPSDAEEIDLFGERIALDGDRAMAGAPVYREGGASVGATFTFRHDGLQWVEVARHLSPDLGATNHFGSATAITGDVCLVGAKLESTLGIDAGAAYSFLAPDLGLRVEPCVATLSESVSFELRGGSSGLPALTFVTAINGAPASHQLLRGNFDAVGVWQQDLVIPNNPALQGLDLDLMSFTLLASGALVASPTRGLEIQ